MPRVDTGADTPRSGAPLDPPVVAGPGGAAPFDAAADVFILEVACRIGF